VTDRHDAGSPHALASAGRVLEGVRVLELATLLAGPFIGMLLRDFGADVVKIEDPGGGDPARHWPPNAAGMSVMYARVNMGKRSIAVNLRDPEGQQLVRDLAATSDVVIENFRPGRLAAWGLGWDELSAINPRLVMVHVTGYGQDGPYRDRPGFGAVAESEGGLAFVNGWEDKPPAIAPFGLGDSIAAMSGTLGAVLGLLGVANGGEGREVDIALYEPTIAFMGDSILRYTLTGEVLQRGGFNVTAPRGCYQTSDDHWIIIAGSSEAVVHRLFKAMDRPDLVTDDRFATNAARLERRGEVEELVANWVATRTRDDVLALLREYDVAAGPVNSAKDVAEDPVFRERGSIREVESERFGGKVLWPGGVLKTTEPVADYVDPPDVGQDTDDVLAEIGVTEERRNQLRTRNVIA
jgi:crotonobetainyl-CoA:carnitine CoA-transferase CaiB-like acyl-CoA transferase